MPQDDENVAGMLAFVNSPMSPALDDSARQEFQSES